MNERPILRCAIYCRKSSEEGLEQDFNSLHAQREACEAYIKSQAHEGWTLVPTAYDDGGYSGGSLERPAIKQLLAEVQAKRVNVVVVYKVDRLTRSLADFARIVETLDQQGASFVSVTQQFNTTTSMGRLTLNVLLSFAQFEREVTGERIRDKIAASKRKGLWMGGLCPTGYQPAGRTLTVVPDQAAFVRHLFTRFLAVGTCSALANELNTQGLRSPTRTSNSGRAMGGARYTPGAVHHILSNPIYVGEIKHRRITYAGQHPAIVDRALWDKAQAQLISRSAKARNKGTARSGAMLKGMIFASNGWAMTPTYSQKPDGRRYRFYAISPEHRRNQKEAPEISRFSAGPIEDLVGRAVQAREGGWTIDHLQKVVVGAASMEIHLSKETIGDSETDSHTSFRVPVVLSQWGLGKRLHLFGDAVAHPEPDEALLRNLILGFRWREQLERGEFESMKALARAEGKKDTYIAQFVTLTYLAPDLLQSLCEGRQSQAMTVVSIRTTQFPLNWEAQRARFSGVMPHPFSHSG